MNFKNDILENFDEEKAYQLDNKFYKKYGFSLQDFATMLDTDGFLDRS